MIKKTSGKIRIQQVSDSGTSKVIKKVLLGERDGSNRIVLRQFTIRSNGHTSRTSRKTEHILFITKGKGEVVDGDGFAHELVPGDCVFIPAFELFHLQNRNSETFTYLNIIHS